jgi:hypothetical protein
MQGRFLFLEATGGVVMTFRAAFRQTDRSAFGVRKVVLSARTLPHELGQPHT